MAPIEAAIAAAVMYKYKRSRVEVSIVKIPCPLSPYVSGSFGVWTGTTSTARRLLYQPLILFCVEIIDHAI
jgi:hypothetical protein